MSIISKVNIHPDTTETCYNEKKNKPPEMGAYYINSFVFRFPHVYPACGYNRE